MDILAGVRDPLPCSSRMLRIRHSILNARANFPVAEHRPVLSNYPDWSALRFRAGLSYYVDYSIRYTRDSLSKARRRITHFLHQLNHQASNRLNGTFCCVIKSVCFTYFNILNFILGSTFYSSNLLLYIGNWHVDTSGYLWIQYYLFPKQRFTTPYYLPYIKSLPIT